MRVGRQETAATIVQRVDCRGAVSAKGAGQCQGEQGRMEGQEELVGGGGWTEILDGQLGETFWGGDMRVKT